MGPVKHIDFDLKQFTQQYNKVLDMQITKFLMPSDILFYEINKAKTYQRAFVIEFPVNKMHEFGGVMELFQSCNNSFFAIQHAIIVFNSANATDSGALKTIIKGL